MAGARLALVVANEDYADDGLRRLAAPGRDADALAEILGYRSVGGFDVQVLRNESAQQIRFAIEDFFADRSPTDLLLVHFSCHGVKNACCSMRRGLGDGGSRRVPPWRARSSAS